RGTRASASAELQHLTDEHQRHDHRGGFEVQEYVAHWIPERGRKQSGGHDGDGTDAAGHADAETDQREHVQVAGTDRANSACEKRTARPQTHWRGRGQLAPRTERHWEETSQPAP